MTTTITDSQAAVLAVLDLGGFLSVSQLARDGRLTAWRTRAAISALRSRGLVTAGVGTRSGRYQISERGHGVIATRARAAR